MKRNTGENARLVLMLLVGLLSVSFGSPPAGAQSSDVVIRGGWVFDTDAGRMVRNTGIVIRAGELFEVGANLDWPDLTSSRIIDLGEDDYVLPGLIDLHAHFSVNLLGRGRRDEYTVNPIVCLANGVTSTYPAGEYDPEGMGEASLRIRRGEQTGSRLFNSGPYFGTARRDWDSAITADEIRAEVDTWAARGVACFKAKGIGPDHLRVLVEQAHRHGLPVAAHLGSGYRDTVNPRDAILMGLDRVEHFLGGDSFTPDRSAYASLVEFEPDTPEFERIAKLYIEHNVYFDATLTAYGYYGRRSEGYDYWVDERMFLTPYVRDFQKEQPPREVNEQFERIFWVKRRTVKAFFEAGGLITLGTDHPSWGEFLTGFAAHRELEAFVLAGIPPADAIRIATLNGARALQVGDELGSIEPGKLADLFVVRGNPLENIRATRNVQIVIKGGEVYDPKALFKSVEGRLGPGSAGEAEGW